MKENRRVSGQAIRETIGIIGVVASLVFVGLEIHQNTAVARGQTRQELAALNQEWLILVATDTVFDSAFRKRWVEPNASPTPSEVFRADFGMRINLRRLENIYFQFEEDLVDRSALKSYGFQVSPVYQSPKFKEWWFAGKEREAFDPNFVSYFEEHFNLSPE